jgi:hypothetical protein
MDDYDGTVAKHKLIAADQCHTYELHEHQDDRLAVSPFLI